MDDSTTCGPLVALRLTTSRPRPDVCVVHVDGELDMATVPALAAHLREQAATRPAALVLDLGGVTLLAAAGMTLIVGVLRDSGSGSLHLTGVTGNRPVEQVLRLTGLRAVLDVQDDLQALLAALPPR